MREKHPRIVMTFHTTAAAMAMERLCAERGLPGRLIPVPRQISADCGLAWSAPVEAAAALRLAAERIGAAVAGWYELMLP